MKHFHGPLVKRLLMVVALQIVWAGSQAQPNKIFPVPYKVESLAGQFVIDNTTSLLLDMHPSESERVLTDFVRIEVSDKYGIALSEARRGSINGLSNYVLVGTLDNPLVKEYCKQNGIDGELKSMNEEGYILRVTQNEIVVAGASRSGALMGIGSLKQLIAKGRDTFVPGVEIKDFPRFPFRGIKLYLPGRKNIAYFKRFVRDFVSLYKFNTIILELNANMRLDKHPELNVGATDLAHYLYANRLDRPLGRNKESTNSSHQDNADGEILEKEEIADLVEYMRRFDIEVIPELPSLTHSYYLLAGHRDLAENDHYDFPDTYCPSNANAYKLYFDVLDEYIEVTRPSMIHIGHDEWRMEKDRCERCRGKDYGKLYADDLNKIYNYLAAKGIKTAIWGDHLLESVSGKGSRHRKTSTGYEYKIPGALTPLQVRELIPKDVLVFNWFWNEIDNDKKLSEMKFKQVYGNMRPDIADWSGRVDITGLLGGAPSSWAATTETNIGKDQMVNFLGAANLLWSHLPVSYDSLLAVVSARVPMIYADLNGKTLPSHNKYIAYSPFDMSAAFNMEFNTAFGAKALSTKEKKNQPIVLNKDISGIIFLHACSQKARNDLSFRMIVNPLETAQLLGWYDVVYEDGLRENIPLRYGINILHWTKDNKGSQKGDESGGQNAYAYQARAIDCSFGNKKITFYEYEWKNPRPGVKIRHLTLMQNENINNNPLYLLKIKIAENITERQTRVIERE